MGSRSLDDLDPRFKPMAIELLARLVEAEIQVMIVQTLRTQVEHQANLAAGTSWIKHSKHLDGLAIDLAPWEQYQLHGPDKLQWDSADPVWKKMGEIGQALGLGWGGVWTYKDMGHFEMKGAL